MYSSEQLSHVEVKTLEYIMERGMEAYRNPSKHYNRDAIFLKNMVMAYKKERMMVALDAVEHWGDSMGLLNSQIQSDPTFFVPLITVTTRHPRYYCVIGYDIDHYFLKWYDSSSEGGANSAKAHPCSVPNTGELVLKLQEGYKMFSGM